MCLMNKIYNNYIFNVESEENFFTRINIFLTKPTTWSKSGLRSVNVLEVRLLFTLKYKLFSKSMLDLIWEDLVILFITFCMPHDTIFVYYTNAHRIVNGIFYLIFLLFFYIVDKNLCKLTPDWCWFVHGYVFCFADILN